jgi:hypothetical protein
MGNFITYIVDFIWHNPSKSTITLLIAFTVLFIISKYLQLEFLFLKDFSFFYFFLIFQIRIRDWFELRNFFNKMGLKGPKPTFFIGNFGDLMTMGVAQYDIEVFKKYGQTVGYFEGSQPVILTKDVKFIKAVMIKDFSCFVNRRVSFILNLNFHLKKLAFILGITSYKGDLEFSSGICFYS